MSFRAGKVYVFFICDTSSLILEQGEIAEQSFLLDIKLLFDALSLKAS